MKKILFIAGILDGGGAERRLCNISCLLAKRGYEVEVLSYFPQNAFSDQLEEARVKVVYMCGNYLQRILRIPAYINNGHFDVSISLLPTQGFLNNLSAMIYRGQRIVITGESSSSSDQFHGVKGSIYTWFQRYSDHLVCNSLNAKQMWEQNRPNYKDKLEVIYNPVMIPEQKVKYTPKRDGKLHILIASSIYSVKNPLGLIEALIQFNEEERRLIKIDWYGRTSTTKDNGGDYLRAVELIKHHNLNDTLIFHGPTSEIYELMANTDAVALFSKLEGLPNAICEGMMLGKPILMTKVSDYSVLVDDENGVLCDWNDPNSIKSAIIKMAHKSPSELLAMGEKSHKKASVLFEKNAVIDRWVDLVERTV